MSARILSIILKSSSRQIYISHSWFEEYDAFRATTNMILKKSYKKRRTGAFLRKYLKFIAYAEIHAKFLGYFLTYLEYLKFPEFDPVKKFVRHDSCHF